MRIPVGSDNWGTSSRSQNSENCVEVALGETVGVRDTKARSGGALAVPPSAWSAFVNGLKVDHA
jgi:hypothetical protein